MGKVHNNRLILYRLEDNIFLTDKRNNISETVGATNTIDSMSINSIDIGKLRSCKLYY